MHANNLQRQKEQLKAKYYCQLLFSGFSKDSSNMFENNLGNVKYDSKTSNLRNLLIHK
jgi:hypothetical protein